MALRFALIMAVTLLVGYANRNSAVVRPPVSARWQLVKTGTPAAVAIGELLALVTFAGSAGVSAIEHHRRKRRA